MAPPDAAICDRQMRGTGACPVASAEASSPAGVQVHGDRHARRCHARPRHGRGLPGSGNETELDCSRRPAQRCVRGARPAGWRAAALLSGPAAMVAATGVAPPRWTCHQAYPSQKLRQDAFEFRLWESSGRTRVRQTAPAVTTLRRTRTPPPPRCAASRAVAAAAEHVDESLQIAYS